MILSRIKTHLLKVCLFTLCLAEESSELSVHTSCSYLACWKRGHSCVSHPNCPAAPSGNSPGREPGAEFEGKQRAIAKGDFERLSIGILFILDRFQGLVRNFSERGIAHPSGHHPAFSVKCCLDVSSLSARMVDGKMLSAWNYLNGGEFCIEDSAERIWTV